jgi:hypothetical protein
VSWRMILLNLLHFVYVLHPPLPPTPLFIASCASYRRFLQSRC